MKIVNIEILESLQSLESKLSATEEALKTANEVLQEFSPRWESMVYPEISVRAESVREKYNSLKGKL